MQDTGAEERATVFVIDDDALTRDSIESLVSAAGFQVRTFSRGVDFMASPPTDEVGCLVLDVELPGINGLELQQQLTARGIRLPIIFLTGRADIPMSVRAIKAGAIEFLTKPFRSDDLLRAIDEAVQRARVLRAERGRMCELRRRFQSLTPRERQVLQLVVSGLLNKQIASQLGISEVTVKIHRSHVMQKTGAASLADLVRMADRFWNQ